MKTVAFFNNKGGVGKTTLVYHLAWMYADMGLQVVAADFDPQANLTAMFLDDDRLERLWPDGAHPNTVQGAIQPLLEGTGDVSIPHVEDVAGNIGLLVGDLSLSSSEDELSSQWPECLDGKPRALRVLSAFWRLIEQAASERDATLVLIDVGPNLGAINRAALIAAQAVVTPLAADLYSLQGLRNLGPTLRRWRREWTDRRERNPVAALSLPGGQMEPAGYVVMQRAVRVDRPALAYERWVSRIPTVYREAVLGENHPVSTSVQSDPNCLASLKHYRSLTPLAQEARKPMFHLRAADGALGAHTYAVRECYKDFERLARRIGTSCGIAM